MDLSRTFSGGSVDTAVYCKLDWLTIVYNGCTTNDVLSALGFNVCEFDEVEKAFAERFLQSRGYLTDLSFTLNGVCFCYHYSDLVNRIGEETLQNIDIYDFFDISCDYIRVDMSGSGLDWLRDIGIDVDTVYRDPMIFNRGGELNFHITRCDQAFDLVNYCPHFLSEYINFIRKNGDSSSGRINTTCTVKSAIKYEVRTGSQTTVYLGTGKSDRLLRIYDKYQQYSIGSRMAKCPYNVGDEHPSSWVRIELQTRREKCCHDLLFGGSFEASLRYIYDTLSVCDSNRQMPECWKEVFDWDTLPQIIQNAKYVSNKTIAVRAKEYIERVAMSNIIVYIANFGWSNFIDLVNSRLKSLQLSDNDLDLKRWCALHFKLLSDNLTMPKYINKNVKGLFELL